MKEALLILAKQVKELNAQLDEKSEEHNGLVDAGCDKEVIEMTAAEMNQVYTKIWTVEESMARIANEDMKLVIAAHEAAHAE